MIWLPAVLWLLAIHLGLLSVISIGGVLPILPELHRLVVDVYGWMSSDRFTDLFAIAQGAPGPNILVVTLIGWHVAGLPGALVATIAIVAPSCIITYVVGRLWHRFRLARWRIVLQAGLVPVTIGLVAASAFLVTRAVGTSAAALALTLATAIAVFYTRVHPLLFLAAGGALGVAGFI